MVIVKCVNTNMNLLNMELTGLTIEEYFIIYGGILMLIGVMWFGISILIWRDRYK
jgi:hypothetical protein